MSYPAKTDRNKQIVEQREKLGWTLQKIGAYWAISRERVRQVLAQAKK